MKRYFLFVVIFTTFLSGDINFSYAEETMDQIHEITSFEQDITGDGIMEHFSLRGSFLSENSSYYHDIWLDVTNEYNDKWKISFASGYEPKLQLIHLTDKRTADLFYSVRKTEQKTPVTYQLYSLRNGKVTSLPLPKVNRMSGPLQEKFRASVTIDASAHTLTISLSNIKQTLLNQSIYDEKGNLNKKRNITVQPIATLKPILLGKNNGYGLKSIQYVTIDQTDIIAGTVESIWYYEKDHWVRVKTNYKQR